jgi:hypothetical protein
VLRLRGLCAAWRGAQVVPFAAIQQRDFYTMSVRGITHYLDGASADFASEARPADAGCGCTCLRRGVKLL